MIKQLKELLDVEGILYAMSYSSLEKKVVARRLSSLMKTHYSPRSNIPQK